MTVLCCVCDSIPYIHSHTFMLRDDLSVSAILNCLAKQKKNLLGMFSEFTNLTIVLYKLNG